MYCVIQIQITPKKYKLNFLQCITYKSQNEYTVFYWLNKIYLWSFSFKCALRNTLLETHWSNYNWDGHNLVMETVWAQFFWCKTDCQAKLMSLKLYEQNLERDILTKAKSAPLTLDDSWNDKTHGECCDNRPGRVYHNWFCYCKSLTCSFQSADSAMHEADAAEAIEDRIGLIFDC